MSSPKNNRTTRRPFHDIRNTNPEGSTPSLDPKELKSQKNKDYYARNRDAILRRRREALEKKQASAAMLKDTEMSPHTPMSKAEDLFLQVSLMESTPQFKTSAPTTTQVAISDSAQLLQQLLLKAFKIYRQKAPGCDYL
ncbi:uncharacterized protein LOC104584506 [Brachypodium distachyon]|uniref:uncharacterized protein LOC104584506 n=1 Tax=Brachypodium distachyon TaxID=15368 RepID=UPI00071CBC58|nr:uncharacterized protein LOC104584506 [Brachypodium distachyon]|eukprot:XP_014758086.1 uncharacterized protein LOC104584506 [Brachypodium distachyon]